MIDLHSHLFPGVDDGAATLEESEAALRVMQEEGIEALVTTPHLGSDLTLRPAALEEALARMDEAWAELQDLGARVFPGLRIERGLEVMLNSPTADLSDPRLRLAGTSFVLVEFPGMTVPPNSVQTVFDLKMRGWKPVIAHPERYHDVDGELAVVGEWRRVGGLLQVNAGSVVGRYGSKAKETAWRLLARGWVSYLASDYHARGRCSVAEARAKVVEKGGEEQADLLLRENPSRLLEDQEPVPVPALRARKPSLWRRLRGG